MPEYHEMRGLVPVLPEPLCLIGTGQSVAVAGKDEPAVPGHLGFEAQGRHDAVDVLGRAAHDLVLDRPGADVAWAVPVEQPGEVRHGDAGHHRVDALFDPGQEGDGVGTQAKRRRG